MEHGHAEAHDSHADEHAHHGHDDHSTVVVFPEALKERLEWLFTPYTQHSLRSKLMDKLFHSHHHHPHAYDINAIDESNHDKNIDRIVFALEKLAALNHHAFTENERRALTPSRTGLLQKGYLTTLNLLPAVYTTHMIMTRSVGLVKIAAILGFVATSNMFLKPIPHYLKERYRLSKARMLAKQYYALKNQKFDDFRVILDPKTPLEVISHYQL